MFKSFPSLKLVPSYSSDSLLTFASEEPPLPPKTSPAVIIPADAKPLLAVPKAPPLENPDPLYSSVVVVDGCAPGVLTEPPAMTPAVAVPKAVCL